MGNSGGSLEDGDLKHAALLRIGGEPTIRPDPGLPDHPKLPDGPECGSYPAQCPVDVGLATAVLKEGIDVEAGPGGKLSPEDVVPWSWTKRGGAGAIVPLPARARLRTTR